MHISKQEEGFAIAALITLVAVAAIGGLIVLKTGTSTSGTAEVAAPTDVIDEAQEVVDDAMDTLEDNMNDALGTRPAGDPSLKDMKDEDMAADQGGDSVSLPEIADEVMVKETPEPAALMAGSFEPYAQSKLEYAETGTVVLYFRADWCPSCVSLDKDINKNVANIPDGTHILTLDYDTETALKAKYGITRQHTLIEVDETGALVKRLTGLNNTLTNVLGQL